MKSMYRFTSLRAFLLAVGMLMIVTHPALAQSTRAEGKFTFKHDVQWGNTALPAGDYTFTLDSTSMPSLLTLRSSSGNVIALIAATGIDKTAYSEGAKLVVTHDGAKSFVSSLYLGELGMTIEYSPAQTKAAHETLISMR